VGQTQIAHGHPSLNTWGGSGSDRACRQTSGHATRGPCTHRRVKNVINRDLTSGLTKIITHDGTDIGQQLASDTRLPNWICA
jgi:hypothetical protein